MTVTTTSRLHRFCQSLGIEDGPQRQAERAWRKVGGRQRRQVIRLARQGRPHPDPYVSSVALTWARQTRFHLRSALALSALGIVLYFGILWTVSLWFHGIIIHSGAVVAVGVIPGSVLGLNRMAKKVEAANQ